MCTESFKERVKNEAITNAKLYEDIFVNFEYLICSEAFDKGYHIIKSDKGNYLHLIGIHTKLSAAEFFDKCISGDIEETDFDFIKFGKSEKSVKGSVRQKIIALPYMVNLFSQQLRAEDNFKRNCVECAFATADNKFTVGFTVSGRPKTLLKGDKLDKTKSKKVDLIFRKPRSSAMLYEDLIFGDEDDIEKYKVEIQDIISKDFLMKKNEKQF